MFDLTSGKLLLLGIVALIVLGPKDFPILLRTIGKYMGIIKRQADEFRAQFDEAMRESELDQLKKDVEGLGNDLNQTVQETQKSISSDLNSVTKDLEGFKDDVQAQLSDPLSPSPHTTGYTPEEVRGIDAGMPETLTEAVPALPEPAPATNGAAVHQASDAPAATTDRNGLNGSSAHTSAGGVESSQKSGA